MSPRAATASVPRRTRREERPRAESVSLAHGGDPAFIDAVMPAIDVALRWFDAEVEGMENLPQDGPFLIVGNHSGGVFMPDYWAFLRQWARERGSSSPLFTLGLDVLFSIPGTAQIARRLGTVPADRARASALLEVGGAVLVYPGGDEDDYRPWTHRHRVDLRGHDGFVKLALRHRVPVVPLVAHGSHDAIIVVARGTDLARRVGLDRLRIHVFPLLVGPLGPALLPVAGPPLPAKVISRVCEPFDWSDLGCEAADDPETIRHCYEATVARMQSAMDELVARYPHPIRSRIGTALGLDRLRGRHR